MSAYLPVRVVRVFQSMDGREAMDDTSHRIQFDSSDGSRFMSHRGPRDTYYCWSTVPDRKGRFWAWTYKPVWRKRSNDPHHWHMVGLTQAKDEAEAKAIVRERFYRAQGR